MLAPGQIVQLRLCDQQGGSSRDQKVRRAIVLDRQSAVDCAVIAGTTQPQDAIAVVQQGSTTARYCGLTETTYFPRDLVLRFSAAQVTPLPHRCPRDLLRKLQEGALSRIQELYARSGELARTQQGSAAPARKRTNQP